MIQHSENSRREMTNSEAGVVVLEAAVRSWPPVEPVALRWKFPVWMRAEGLDTSALKSDKSKITINQIADKVFGCLKEHVMLTKTTIRAKLNLSGEKVNAELNCCWTTRKSSLTK